MDYGGPIRDCSTLGAPQPYEAAAAIHVAYSVCGNRGTEALTSTRLAIMTSAARNVLHFHIFWDGSRGVLNDFLEPFASFASGSNLRAFLSFYAIDASASFQKFFALCSMNRLLLARMIPHIPRVIYLVGSLGSQPSCQVGQGRGEGRRE